MKLPKTILLALLLAFGCRDKQISEPEILTIEDFDWTITVPENFRLLDDRDWRKIEEKGEHAIEKTFDAEMINEAENIFVYKNGQLNTLESNWQPYNQNLDGDYLSLCYEINGMLYKTLESQIPNVKIDSASSTQKIDGLDFHRFEMKIDLPNGIKMNTIGFNRQFGKRDLTINITYVDEKIGREMMESVLSSKFK